MENFLNKIREERLSLINASREWPCEGKLPPSEAAPVTGAVIGLAAALIHLQEYNDTKVPEDYQAYLTALNCTGALPLLRELDNAALLPVRRDGQRP